MSRLLPPLFVLMVWLALWGEVTVPNIISGVLVVGLIGLIIRPVPRRHTLNPLALGRLLAVFVWRLVSSSMTVVLAVLAPTPQRLRSGVVGVRLTQHSQLVATVVADAISLTPGTLTLEARYPDDEDAAEGAPPVLYIHVLGLADPEAIRADVHSLERLVLSAISPTTVEPAPGSAQAGTGGEEQP